jgi:alkylhydroperoxidase/carboxymuconolactone decarboxylase family protein YurZ
MTAPDTSWMAEWERMTGRVSDVVKDIRDVNPVAEEGYRNLRSWIYQERPDGLSRASKEMVMVVMNISLNRKDAAIRHLKHGLNNGLTMTQLRELMSMLFLFQGVGNFLETGQAVWQAAREIAAELEAGDSAKR